MKSIQPISLAFFLLLGPALASADLIPTALERASESVSPAPLAADALAAQPVTAIAVRGRLQALGLTPAQAEERMSLLSPADLEGFSAHPDQVQVAGMSLFGLGEYATTTTALVIGGLFLAVIILNAIFRFL